MMNKNKILSFILFVIIFGFASQVHATDIGFTWAKNVGGVGNFLTIFKTTVDTNGNSYVAGYFTGTIDFDPGAGITNLVSAGTNDIFITKFDSSGVLVWAKSVGSSTETGWGGDVTKSIAIDGSGNVYVSGFFSGTVDFDPGAGTSNLTTVGGVDIYVLKLDSSGNFVWVKQMGGTSGEETVAITVDSSGNVYITGGFLGTVDFDPGAGTANLVSSAGYDIFVTKLDTDGTFVWAKGMLGGSGYDYGISITVDSSGNVYTFGQFTGTVDFDPGAGTSNITSAGGNDIFITKFDSSGVLVWAKAMGGTGADSAWSIVLDSSNNLYAVGAFQNTVDFDPGAGTTNLVSTGSNDIYILKLDSSGNFVWVKQMGGTGSDMGYSIALDSSNNIYTAGFFNSTVDFDPGAGTSNLTSAGGNDIFINKLDSSGNFVYVKQIGGTGNEEAKSLFADTVEDNLYIFGQMAANVDLDPTAGVDTHTVIGTQDLFLLKLSPADTTPSTITFTPQTDKNASTSYTSNTITLAGINTGATISISGCSNATNCEYSLNSAAFTSNSGTVVNGDTVILHMTTSNISEATSTLSLTIGTTTTTYTVINAPFASVPVYILQAESDAARLLPPVVLPPTNTIVFCEGNYAFSPITGERCTTNTNNTTSKFIFTKNLQYRDNNTDVKELQKFLNNNGFSVSITGVGSLNNETNYFGTATRSALIKFQIANSIKPAVGYFGILTRNKINNSIK